VVKIPNSQTPVVPKKRYVPQKPREAPPDEFKFNSLKSPKEHYRDYRQDLIANSKKQSDKEEVDFVKIIAKQEVSNRGSSEQWQDVETSLKETLIMQEII
jgi:hypothetical protein